MLDHKKVEKVLTVILESLIYLSFLMPFVYVNQSIFPFIVGKMLYFQSLVQLMLIVYLLLLVVNFGGFWPKKSMLLYWFGFYALTLLLSAVFGVDFNRAFWSNFERMTGVFVIFHFITYSIIISVIFNSWPKIRRAIQVFLGVGLIELAVVAAQYVKPGVFLYPNKGGRIWGTLGNSIYIGTYFLFHIFFALFLAVKEKKHIWLQIFYLTLALIYSWVIIYSDVSTGVTLSLLGGFALAFFIYTIFSANKKLRFFGWTVLAATVLMVVLMGAFRESPLLQKNRIIRDLVNISFEKSTGRTRVIAWEIALKALKERPILGWGTDTFYYAFNKFYNPESLRYSYYETWFDRSHSIIFDTLAMGGVLGFISYFGLFALGLGSLISGWRKQLVDRHIFILFFVIFAAYLAQNLFVFDHPASYLFIYFTFGLLLAFLSPQEKHLESSYQYTYFSFFVVAVLLLVGYLTLFFSTSVKTYRAATGIIDAEKMFVHNFKNGFREYQEILKMKTPFIDDMRATAAKRILSAINESQFKLISDYHPLVLFAREKMLEQTKERRIDVYDYMLLGQIDTMLYTLDKKYLTSADEFFGRARELSPRRQQIYYSWAKLKMMNGDFEEAEQLLKIAVSLEEKVPDSYWYLGIIYGSANKPELAWEYLNKAISRNYVWKNVNEVYYLLDLGEKLKKDKELPRFYLTAIEQSPRADLYLGLARVYQRLGDERQAIDAFLKAKEMDPDIIKKYKL